MAVGQPRYSKEEFEVDASEIAACDRLTFHLNLNDRQFLTAKIRAIAHLVQVPE